MFWPFQRIQEQEVTNAVLAFGGAFYKSLKQNMDASSADVLALQMEFPIMAISVANAFIGLRKPNSRKLLASNTKNTVMAYARHFEGITKGKVSAESYAAKLTNRLTQGQGMEYIRIMCEESPETQPALLTRRFLQSIGASIRESGFDQANEGVAKSLSLLIEGLRKAGV